MFLLQTTLLAWSWSRYARAWEALHRTTILPTPAELRLHLDIIPATPYLLGAAGLLLLTFLAFCLQAILTRRWWGWPVLFLGQAGGIGAVWWVYRIEMFRLEQRMAWDDVLPGGAGSLLDEPADLLAPKLLGAGLTVFFLTLAIFCAGRGFAARAARRRMSALRSSMLTAGACPKCGGGDTFERVTEGFASGKVRRCSACGHTEPIGMEADLSE